MSFSQLPAAKKNTENGAAVTSLRLFSFCQDFRSDWEATTTKMLYQEAAQLVKTGAA